MRRCAAFAAMAFHLDTDMADLGVAAAQVLSELVSVTATLARDIDAHVVRIELSSEAWGGEYHDGVITLGVDVADVAEWAAAVPEDPAPWWILGRLLAHETVHGRHPRARGALEEAVAEALGRDLAPGLLSECPSCPDPEPGPGFWEVEGVYRPQVRWLSRLGAWAELGAEALGWALKSGRPHRGEPADALERNLGAVIASAAGLSLGEPALRRLGSDVARTAGSVNDGAHVRPRSGARAAERAICAIGSASPAASRARPGRRRARTVPKTVRY